MCLYVEMTLRPRERVLESKECGFKTALMAENFYAKNIPQL